MIKPSEAIELIAIAKAMGFGGVQVDELSAIAWATVLNDGGASYEDAKTAILGLRVNFITVADVVDEVRHMNRLLPTDIAADVRVARSLGWIDADWPETNPVPEDVAYRLKRKRERERDRLAEIETEDRLTRGALTAADYGVTVKSVPDD